MPLSSLSAWVLFFPPSLPAFISWTLFSNLVKCNIWCSVPELSSENLRTCFQIVNAYIYLSATDFLQVRHTNTYTHTYTDTNSHTTYRTSPRLYEFYFHRTMQNHCVGPSVICWKTSRMRDRSKCSRYRQSIPLTHITKLDLFILSLTFLRVHLFIPPP